MNPWPVGDSLGCSLKAPALKRAPKLFSCVFEVDFEWRKKNSLKIGNFCSKKFFFSSENWLESRKMILGGLICSPKCRGQLHGPITKSPSLWESSKIVFTHFWSKFRTKKIFFAQKKNFFFQKSFEFCMETDFGEISGGAGVPRVTPWIHHAEPKILKLLKKSILRHLKQIWDEEKKFFENWKFLVKEFFFLLPKFV